MQSTSPGPATPSLKPASGNSPDSAHAAAVILPSSDAGTRMDPAQMAKMVSRAAQSEMRIGLNTSAFGSVEVHTVIRASDVGLVIGSERGDLRALLANELPGITNTLQQHDLRLSQVNFHQGFAFSNNLSSGGDSQSRSFPPRPGPMRSAVPEPGRDDSTDPEARPATRRLHAGLSILV